MYWHNTTVTIALNLLQRALRRHGLFVAVIGALLAIFPILVSAAVTTLDVESVFGGIRRALPPLLQESFGPEMALTMTSRGLLVFAWNHPVVHVMLASVMITLAHRAIAGEIEAGTLELLLSQPLSRPLYLATQISFAALVLLSLLALMLLGTYLGLRLFGLLPAIPWRVFVPVAANLFSLETVIYAVALLLSSYARESSRVVAPALLLVLLAYLLQAVARLWSRLGFLLKFSIFEYYSPLRIILLEEAPRPNIASLLLLGGFLAGWAWWKFIKRDVP